MKDFYRVMLGKGSVHAEECFAGNFIGADFDIDEDLSKQLPEDWRAFNKRFIPLFLKTHPEKSRIAAGLACGALWTVAKGIERGDLVLCPDGEGSYRVGEVIGEYAYVAGGTLPHRRSVRWFSRLIKRSEMSDSLRHSTGSIGTISKVSVHGVEIERLMDGATIPVIVSTDPAVEDPVNFALEQHLEEFLVRNWAHTELGKSYDIYEEEGEQVGQQYPTDTGPIDILATSKDRRTLLVVELKKGRASDGVVGQVLRYMGFVQEELAEDNQTVSGVIIALEDDSRIRRALAMVPTIHFYRYQMSFKLFRT